MLGVHGVIHEELEKLALIYEERGHSKDVVHILRAIQELEQVVHRPALPYTYIDPRQYIPGGYDIHSGPFQEMGQ